MKKTSRILGILLLSVLFFFVGCDKGEKKSDAKPGAAMGPSLEGKSAAELFGIAAKLYDQKKYFECSPYMKKAAEMGHAEAQSRLGKMYFNAWGVPHSHEIARKWHEKAAAQGNKESIKKLKNFRH